MSAALRRCSLTLLVLSGWQMCWVGCDGGRAPNLANRAAQKSDAKLLIPRDFAERSHNTEAYARVPENPFVDVAIAPKSTFFIDVDTAAYSNVRRMLVQGRLPPTEAVRIEELVNYFSYSYPEPTNTHPITIDVQSACCPWNAEHRLVRVALKGKSVARAERPHCSLVFLLDVSGSMMDSNKLPLVKSAMRLLVSELGEHDRIAIVTYAGESGVVLPSTPANRTSRILEAIEQLQAAGSTNGSAGISLAYSIAQENFMQPGINRVILCTDGDFNVGVTNERQLVKLITEKAKNNIFLSVLGFGEGNLKDATMEKLADTGNGNYAYIDSLLEARKVLVQQMGGTLQTIAKDVKLQLDFNPKQVKSYRLIGYENRALTTRDFRDDRKDSGEIGAGHTVTAFYELLPREEPFNISECRSLVSARDKHILDPDTMLTVRLRYKLPDAVKSSELEERFAEMSDAEPTDDFYFASAVIAYGMLLKHSRYTGSANWAWVIETAEQHVGDDGLGLRREFVNLAKIARRLSEE